MKITIKDLKNIAKEFLFTLNKEKILSTEDLEKRLDSKFELNKPNFISITLKPSNFDTFAYTLSYTRPRTGIPIELIINPQLDYSQIILKTQKRIEGYSQFSLDPYNNIIQNKVIRSSDLLLVKKELENLSK